MTLPHFFIFVKIPPIRSMSVTEYFTDKREGKISVCAAILAYRIHAASSVGIAKLGKLFDPLHSYSPSFSIMITRENTALQFSQPRYISPFSRCCTDRQSKQTYAPLFSAVCPSDINFAFVKFILHS